MRIIWVILLLLGNVKGTEKTIFEKISEKSANWICLFVYKIKIEERPRRYRKVVLDCTVTEVIRGNYKIGDRVHLILRQEPTVGIKPADYLGELYYQFFDVEDITESGIEAQTATTFPYRKDLAEISTKLEKGQ